MSALCCIGKSACIRFERVVLGQPPYLVLPSRTSATPYSSPNETSNCRYASNARPSRRMFSWSAWRMNARSLSEGSASRGIMSMAESRKSLAFKCQRPSRAGVPLIHLISREAVETKLHTAVDPRLGEPRGPGVSAKRLSTANLAFSAIIRLITSRVGLADDCGLAYGG